MEKNLGYCINSIVMNSALISPSVMANINVSSPLLSPWQAVSRIEAALSFARKQIEDIDLFVLEHSAFGKGIMKKCKMSPDAFIQMALQLTYYKVLYSVV